MRQALRLAVVVFVGCGETTSPAGCPQPAQPTCVARTVAWCTTATELFSSEVIEAEGLADASTLVACPNASGNGFFAIFDAGINSDDAGIPMGCPSLSVIPGDLSKTVTGAGTENAGLCCYPTKVFCD